MVVKEMVVMRKASEMAKKMKLSYSFGVFFVGRSKNVSLCAWEEEGLR